jgi:hypothetical protein
VASEFQRNLNHIVGKSLEAEFGADTIVVLMVRVLSASVASWRPSQSCTNIQTGPPLGGYRRGTKVT